MIGAITAGLYGTGVPPVTNSYESIATVTVGSGGNTYITFSSIPSTYKHLQIRWSALNSSAMTDVYARFNSDSGSNYSFHQVYGDGSSTAAGGFANQSAFYCGIGGNTTSPSVGVVDLLEYQNTNIYKTGRSLAGIDLNGSGYVQFKSGGWRNTAAISTIDIYATTGTFNQNSKFALYGIKG